MITENIKDYKISSLPTNVPPTDGKRINLFEFLFQKFESTFIAAFKLIVDFVRSHIPWNRSKKVAPIQIDRKTHTGAFKDTVMPEKKEVGALPQKLQSAVSDVKVVVNKKLNYWTSTMSENKVALAALSGIAIIAAGSAYLLHCYNKHTEPTKIVAQGMGVLSDTICKAVYNNVTKLQKTSTLIKTIENFSFPKFSNFVINSTSCLETAMITIVEKSTALIVPRSTALVAVGEKEAISLVKDSIIDVTKTNVEVSPINASLVPLLEAPSGNYVPSLEFLLVSGIAALSITGGLFALRQFWLSRKVQALDFTTEDKVIEPQHEENPNKHAFEKQQVVREEITQILEEKFEPLKIEEKLEEEPLSLQETKENGRTSGEVDVGQQRVEEEAKVNAEEEELRIKAEEIAEQQRLEELVKANAKEEELRIKAEEIAEQQRLEELAKANAKEEELRIKAEEIAEQQRLEELAKANAKEEELRIKAEEIAERQRIEELAKANAKEEELQIKAEKDAERQRIEELAKANAKEEEELQIKAEKDAESQRVEVLAKANAKEEIEETPNSRLLTVEQELDMREKQIWDDIACKIMEALLKVANNEIAMRIMNEIGDGIYQALTEGDDEAVTEIISDGLKKAESESINEILPEPTTIPTASETEPFFVNDVIHKDSLQPVQIISEKTIKSTSSCIPKKELCEMGSKLSEEVQHLFNSLAFLRNGSYGTVDDNEKDEWSDEI